MRKCSTCNDFICDSEFHDLELRYEVLPENFDTRLIYCADCFEEKSGLGLPLLTGSSLAPPNFRLTNRQQMGRRRTDGG
jgi:hypothetical protein